MTLKICLMMELIILKRKLKLMRKMKNAFLILLPYMVINIPREIEFALHMIEQILRGQEDYLSE